MPTFSEIVDFTKTEAQNLVTHKLPGPPSVPVEGQRYYDTGLKREGVYNGSSWDYAGGSSSGLGLLGYAQQNVSHPLTRYSWVIIPFATEVINSLNIFLNGFFTPTVTGVYKFSCTLRYACTAQMNLHGAAAYQGAALVGLLSLSETYTATVTESSFVSVPLTAGLAYHVRGYSDGPTPTVGASPGTNLTIERLS